MQTVLLTGANGFVGYYLVRQLLQKGYRVVATGKGENRLPYTDENFRYLSLDFCDRESVEKVFAESKPAYVVHGGAISKPDECEQNREAAFLSNVTGTIHLLKEAASCHAHFIFLSTDFVFSGDRGHYKEEDLRSPVNYYGLTKMLAEDEVMRYLFDWSIVRMVLVYGRSFSGRENIVTNTAKALEEGKPLKIFDDQFRTPTYVEDLVSGILLLIENGATGIFHFSGEDIQTPFAMAVETARLLGYDETRIQAVKAEEFHQPARRPPNTTFDLTKAKTQFGFRPLSFAEGLKRTFQ